MELELKELLTYFSSTNYGEGYLDQGRAAYNTGPKSKPISDAMIAAHMNGGTFLGVNTTLDEWGHTKAVVFDIDCKKDEDADRRDDIFGKITDALTKDKVPFLAFVSGSGKGRHVFVLFSKAVPKSYARLFGARYAELTGIGEKDGVLEVFPKRNEIDKVENIALPLARKSAVIGEFKIVPFDPVTWKPTLTAYQLDVRSKIEAAFVEDAEGKVAAYGVKIPAQDWNSFLGRETIAKAGFAYLSADGEHIYALCFPKDPKRANDSRLEAKKKFSDDLAIVLKAAPPMPYEGLGFQVTIQDDYMAYITRREVTTQAPAKPGRKGKAQDNNAAFDCAAKMYEVDEYAAPETKDGKKIDKGWLSFMMACHSAFKHDANQLAWVRGRFLDWSAQSPKYDSKNDPIKFDEEGPRSETSPRVFWAKAVQGGYKGATPHKKDDLEAETIIDLVLDGKHVFLGPQREPYIEMGKRHYVLLDSKEFGLYVRDKVYTSLGKTLSKDAIDSIAATIESSIRSDEEVPVATRCASHGDKAYLSLADKNHTVIEIDGHCWHECSDPPVRFAKTDVMEELPKPEAGGSIDDLAQFINFGDNKDSMLSTLAYLVKVILKPESVTPALLFQGEKGSGKTIALEHTAMMVDPQSVLTAAPPKTETDLVIAAINSYIVSFDNVSSFDYEFSDAVCRLITGNGIKSRTLYTNRRMSTLKAKRPMIFSGIDPAARRSDLVERFIFVDLQRVQKFVSDDELRAAFLKARPLLLGALLSLCVKTKKMMATFPTPATNRMADFCHVGEALSRVLGNADDYFVTMYNEQAEAEQEHIAEGDIVVRLMHEELKSLLERNAPSAEFKLHELLDRWTIMKGTLSMVGYLPTSSVGLGSMLSRNLSKLSNDDYIVAKGKDSKGNRVWKATSRLEGREEKTPFYDVPEEFAEMHVTRPDGSVEVIQGKWDPVMDARAQLSLRGMTVNGEAKVVRKPN